MVRITLSPEEAGILKNYFQTSPIPLMRLKAQAIIMRAGDMKLKDMEMSLFRDERTIERWIKDFSDRRTSSIFNGLVGNDHAAKLTPQQKEEVHQVLQQKPQASGLPKAFWDIPQLKKYIYARFGQVYESVRSYHYLLEFGNLSFKYPDRFNIRRNEVQIASRMEQIYSEIIPYLEDESWEVFCSDETRMQLEAIRRKAWLKKGEKTVLKVERSKEYQNYLGFLNLRTFQCYTQEIVWGRAEEIIRATSEFIKRYPQKKICIIWDNATCHKGILMRQALSTGGLLERVHIVPLPPYAPDHNPIEHVWETTKANLANDQCPTFAETKQKFIQQTDGKFFPYQI